MSIRQKENIDTFPSHTDVLFRCNFDGQISTIVRRIFFDVISMSEKSTSFFGNFDEQNIYVVSMYFSRPDFNGR